MPTDRDRWLLPRQQTEYPARALLPEAILHGRREMTFLTLASLYFVATTVLVVLGFTRAIDLSALLAHIAPADQIRATLLPLGVVPFALSFVASALICELLGRRRAGAVVLLGAVTSGATVGVMALGDRIDGGGAGVAAAALAIAAVVAHVSHVLIFDLLR